VREFILDHLVLQHVGLSFTEHSPAVCEYKAHPQLLMLLLMVPLLLLLLLLLPLMLTARIPCCWTCTPMPR
jgi:hypothetical protein